MTFTSISLLLTFLYLNDGIHLNITSIALIADCVWSNVVVFITDNCCRTSSNMVATSLSDTYKIEGVL